jgi:hypothetical protein
VNGSDFALGAAEPRNSAIAVFVCNCPVPGAANESNLPVEIDHCHVASPTSLALNAGQASPTVYGRVYEGGSTEAPGPSPSLTVELGFGPSIVNPTTQSGFGSCTDPHISCFNRTVFSGKTTAQVGPNLW